MNMAFDGDIVAVELLPQEQWHEEKSLALADGGNRELKLVLSRSDWICTKFSTSLIPKGSGRFTYTKPKNKDFVESQNMLVE
uniref:Uncharacterized protein n=1 Tax=Solanum tuberosum TaxID=4113 RepID=M1CGB1_SOLTU